MSNAMSPKQRAANETSASTRNATHSVMLTAIAGEFVLSCFPVVAGEVETDTEIFVESFTDIEVARRVYASRAKLLACTAAEFDAEVSGVYYALTSLAGCRSCEVANEAGSVRRAVRDLQLCTLARRSPQREAIRARAIELATQALARRTAA